VCSRDFLERVPGYGDATRNILEPYTFALLERANSDLNLTRASGRFTKRS